jgi:hypothetical protein
MARHRRLAPKDVVSSDKFVRVVILPLRGKDHLSGKGGKWLKECRDHYPACDHLQKPLKNLGSC